MIEKLYKVAVFAKKIGVSRTLIYNMLKATRDNTNDWKHIRYVKRQRGTQPIYMIPESELAKFANMPTKEEMAID